MKKNFLFALLFVLGLACCTSQKIQFETDVFSVVLNAEGEIRGLLDKNSGTDYFAPGQHSYLLLLRIDTTFYHPRQLEWIEKGRSFKLVYPDCRASVDLKVNENSKYLSFEITDYQSEMPVDVAVWGPYATTIKQMVGECVGVVRDSCFAIGIQSLNAKTLGGFPSEESDVEYRTKTKSLELGSGIADIDKNAEMLYRGQTASHKDFGSVLQAYCRNRSKERIVSNWGHTHYVAPAYDDNGIKNSKIALFGCPVSEALDYIEAIELGENLPHPTLDGVWSKKSKLASQAYIIYPFNENNIKKALNFTKQTGLKYLYHGGPFSEWGHFVLNPKEFPSGWDGLRKCVEIAKAEGIKLGVHTLSNFITTNDKYVTPVPDRRLAIVGASKIVRDIDSKCTEIEIADPMFFNQMKNNNLHGVRIDDELIRYERVSDSAPWKLLNCTRGAWGTTANNHKKGDEIVKLMDHGYKTFLSNTELTKEMARTLADLFNKTGIRQISFDGLEGCYSTGMGEYGESLMMQEWYNHLKPEYRDNINDASMTTHFNWHIFTRMNWGEPWYAGFRESHTNYRLMNQDFFRRNLIPAMLGWFTLSSTTSIEDINWLLARSAAFDAGYCLVTNDNNITKNACSTEIIEAVREWEKARLGGAFPKELKKEMTHLYNEYKLEITGENSWNLYSCKPMRFIHQNTVRQPGEPVVSKWEFNNPHKRQPVRFLLKANDIVSDISLEIGNFSTVTIPVKLNVGETVKYDGGSDVVVYDKNWNALKTISIDSKKLEVPEGSVSFIFSCKFASHDNQEKKMSAEFKTFSEAIPLKIK